MSVMCANLLLILRNFNCPCLQILRPPFNFSEKRICFRKDSQEYVLEKTASSGFHFPVACVFVCLRVHVRAYILVLEQVLLDDVLSLKLMFILKAVIVHQVHSLSWNKDSFFL